MPTYEFCCDENHVTTEWMPISKCVDELICATCKKPSRRQIGAGSPPMFKGGGFYCNDYKKPEPKKKEEWS